MPQISFQADTQNELITMVRRWISGTDATGEQPVETRERTSSSRQRELFEVLNHLKGADSRRFVRELAQAASQGDAVPFDAELRSRYGKTNGTAFAGMVAGPNKVMRRIADRDLITRDAATGDYRIDQGDAAIILAHLG